MNCSLQHITSNKDQSNKDQSNKDQSNKDQSNKDQSTKDQSTKDQSTKDQSTKDPVQINKEQEYNKKYIELDNKYINSSHLIRTIFYFFAIFFLLMLFQYELYNDKYTQEKMNYCIEQHKLYNNTTIKPKQTTIKPKQTTIKPKQTTIKIIRI